MCVPRIQRRAGREKHLCHRLVPCEEHERTEPIIPSSAVRAMRASALHTQCPPAESHPPWATALRRGVRRSGTDLSGSFTRLPAERRKRTTASWPPKAARWIASAPPLSPFTSAPARTRNWHASSLPLPVRHDDHDRRSVGELVRILARAPSGRQEPLHSFLLLASKTAPPPGLERGSRTASRRSRAGWPRTRPACPPTRRDARVLQAGPPSRTSPPLRQGTDDGWGGRGARASGASEGHDSTRDATRS